MISEIISKRRYGRIRINYFNEYCSDLNDILKMCCLVPEKGRLKEVSYAKAKKIVSILLHKGLAFPEEFISVAAYSGQTGTPIPEVSGTLIPEQTGTVNVNNIPE